MRSAFRGVQGAIILWNEGRHDEARQSFILSLQAEPIARAAHVGDLTVELWREPGVILRGLGAWSAAAECFAQDSE